MNNLSEAANAALPDFSRHEGRDEQTAETVRKTELIAASVSLGLLVLCMLPVLGTFFSNLWKNGFGSALGNGLLTLVIMALVFLGLNRLVGALLLRPYRALQYRASMKRMTEALPSLGIAPAVLHQWQAPNPGVLALDTQRGVLYVNARSANYQRLFLTAHEIIGVKVERESEIHTQTTHGGSMAVFSSAGFGYNFGSRSKSTSVTVERAFLEIHYQLPGAPAPEWVAIPFGENRREADSMAVAIQRL
ncbi:MAG: hypothetical protein Q4G71_13940 [Pseudomonadota bacterium]|nr:hypothetical protein [Pseudomonadota bacterium]